MLSRDQVTKPLEPKPQVRPSFYKASIRYIDLLSGSYNGNYPPENQTLQPDT